MTERLSPNPARLTSFKFCQNLLSFPTAYVDAVEVVCNKASITMMSHTLLYDIVATVRSRSQLLFNDLQDYKTIDFGRSTVRGECDVDGLAE